MSQFHFLEQFETIHRDLRRAQDRMVKATGKNPILCDAYLAVNFVDFDKPILIIVGISESDKTRWRLGFDEFDWSRLRPEIEAAAEKTCAAHPRWSVEDVGRTLGVITDQPAAQAA